MNQERVYGSGLVDLIGKWVESAGMPSLVAHWSAWFIVALAVVIVAIIANYIARRILLSAISIIVKRTKTSWDDYLIEHRVFYRLSHIAPGLVFYYAAPLFPAFETYIHRFSSIYILITLLMVFFAFLNAVNAIYNTFKIARNRPIKGYLQVVQIIFAIFVGVMVISTVLGQPPGVLLGGLGAMTAVLILVFKDSILGLVASIQLSSNDMVRIGDWIEMPKYGADGDVVDITLHSVKVQNWDKTYSTIPAYALISDSFINWRGMSESGGRRIKRAIFIDVSTIKFCDEEMLKRFSKYQHITEYIQKKKDELAEYNNVHSVDLTELVNGRRMTNVGTLRAYMKAYLLNHPQIHDNMTFLVRQLPPGEHGLPLEIYVFSKDQVWANYEGIMADLFDHFLAIIPHFDLRVFQNPSGHDVRQLGGSLKRLN